MLLIEAASKKDNFRIIDLDSGDNKTEMEFYNIFLWSDSFQETMDGAIFLYKILRTRLHIFIIIWNFHFHKNNSIDS